MLSVSFHNAPIRIAATETIDARLKWIGLDAWGVGLKIVALDLPDAAVVIYVMPTSLRR